MKFEKYSRNIYVYQLKYLNKSNLNREKTFRHLNPTFQSANFIKFLPSLTDFPKVTDMSPTNFAKLFAASTTFIKVVYKSHDLHNIVGIF